VFTQDIDLLAPQEAIERLVEVAGTCGFRLPAGPMRIDVGTERERLIRRISKVGNGQFLTLNIITVEPSFSEVWRTRQKVEWRGCTLQVVSREAGSHEAGVGSTSGSLGPGCPRPGGDAVPFDLSPDLVDRWLRDLGELYTLGCSLPKAPLSDLDDRLYAEAVACFRDGAHAAALPVLQAQARRGLAEAQCLLGNAYDLGWGVPADPVEAERWYLAAASQGDPVASNNLGTMCLRRGDEFGARAWYERARELGFPHAPPL
jgi:hypothetical protein